MLSSIWSMTPKTPTQACTNLKRNLGTCYRVALAIAKMAFFGSLAISGYKIATKCSNPTNTCFASLNTTSTTLHQLNCNSTITDANNSHDLPSDNCLLLTQSYGMLCLFLTVVVGAKISLLKIPIQAKENDLNNTKKIACLKTIAVLTGSISGFLCSSFEWGCHSKKFNSFALSPLNTNTSRVIDNDLVKIICYIGQILALISAGAFSTECGLVFISLILNEDSEEVKKILKRLNSNSLEMTSNHIP